MIATPDNRQNLRRQEDKCEGADVGCVARVSATSETNIAWKVSVVITTPLSMLLMGSRALRPTRNNVCNSPKLGEECALQYRWGSQFFACRAHKHTHALILLRSAPRCSLRPKLGQESSITPQGQAMQFQFILRAHHRYIVWASRVLLRTHPVLLIFGEH